LKIQLRLSDLADPVAVERVQLAVLRQVGSALYANCDDWVQCCAAIVEHLDGSLKLVRCDEYALAEGTAPVAADALRPK
jgi:hypothetical protein